MTVPDKNAPKPEKTDQVARPTDDADRPPEPEPTLGRQLKEAMEQADVRREDFA